MLKYKLIELLLTKPDTLIFSQSKFRTMIKNNNNGNKFKLFESTDCSISASSYLKYNLPILLFFMNILIVKNWKSQTNFQYFSSFLVLSKIVITRYPLLNPKTHFNRCMNLTSNLCHLIKVFV